MPVSSMTGFGRYEGRTEGAEFTWELRSVNGKSLEMRVRLPQGFESLEPSLRKLTGERLSRGNLQISLSVRRTAREASLIINRELLDSLLRLSDEIVRTGRATLPAADGLLAMRGVIDVAESVPDADLLERQQRDAMLGFEAALADLVSARHEEGNLLLQTLLDKLNHIAVLVEKAEGDPSRSLEALRERLRAQVADLVAASTSLDEGRLHQEAALLATRFDVREELDRLRAHIVSARDLLAAGGPSGRRLDFLSQEFNRESNTLCSKSSSAALTAIGLDLKVVVDQFREQVQNIE